MRILFLAPQPFYQHRGSPIAIRLALEVLAERGDVVDLLVYHEGEDIDLPGIFLTRTPNLKFLNGVRPGFSWKKLVSDGFMAVMAVRRCATTRYAIVHAVEESVFIALLIKLLWGIPYVYDMDSSLPEQLVEKYPALMILLPLLRLFERLAVKQAYLVVPVCDALSDTIRPYAPRRVVILYDAPLPQAPHVTADLLENLRQRPQAVLVMYVGNLELYQGIDLLLESFALAYRQAASLHLIIIGGRADDIVKYRQKSRDLEIAESVNWLGPRPVTQLASLLAQADILVSPRIRGSNTPMKIYSYLESGKPILATNLPTHTQVLDSHIAVLAPPNPLGFAESLVRLAGDPTLCRALGEAGKREVAEKYSYGVFHQTLSNIMTLVEQEVDTHLEKGNLP